MSGYSWTILTTFSLFCGFQPITPPSRPQTHSNRTLAQNTQPFSSPIPWRKPHPKYTKNEIYFDIEETIDAILDRRGKTLSSEIWGKIKCNAKLSGNPDLVLRFSTPKVADNCSFHPCVRYKKWMKDKVLSFIPPDGSFELMEYQVAKPLGVDRPIPLPLVLKPVMQLTGDGGGSHFCSLGMVFFRSLSAF